MKNVILIFFSLLTAVLYAQNSSEKPLNQIESKQASTSNLMGKVFVGGMPTDSVRISAYIETAPNQLRFVRSTISAINTGAFEIKKLEEGVYYLLAQPIAKKLEGKYASTYYGDSVIWSSSKACYIQGQTSGKDINLTPITSINGSEQIRGSVRYGEDIGGYKLGDPVVSAPVYFFNLKNQLIGWASTDQNGDFFIQNLPSDNVKVFANILGKISKGIIIEPTKKNMNLDFLVTQNQVYGVYEALGVDGNIVDKTRIYPNPAKTQLTIDNQGEYQNVLIYDLNGKIVYSNNLIRGANNIELKGVNSATYYMRLGGEKKSNTQTLIIEK